jgi:hypothetical protein
MKILITIPGFSPHGGIRVILEWANRLQKLGNEVTLLCSGKVTEIDWFKNTVPIVTNVIASKYDCLIITSPHDVNLLDSYHPKKKFVFVQMLEHLFNPTNINFYEKCVKFYRADCPMFAISKWNIESMTYDFGRAGKTIYIGNGINLDDFPISHKEKDYKTILLESPEPTNCAKDVDRLALKFGSDLKQSGYRITGYGIKKPESDIFDEFIVKPDLPTLNRLYEDAFLMIKATRYDARSTAPIEAMTKGTVTLRAIGKGDDDLDSSNSFRCDYNENSLFIELTGIILNLNKIKSLQNNCRYYAQENNWDKIINFVNTKLHE